MSQPLTNEELQFLLGERPFPGASVDAPRLIRDRLIRGVDLGKVELTDVTFEHLDVENVTWTVLSFSRCVFRNVNFIDCTLDHANVEDVSFEDCRFFGTTISDSNCRAVLKATHLANCTIRRTNLNQIECTDCSFASVNFLETFWQGDFSKTTFENSSFDQAKFKDVDFNEANLRACFFLRTDWSRTRFARTAIDQCFFNDGSFDNLTLANSSAVSWHIEDFTGSTLTFEDFEAEDLRLFGLRATLLQFTKGVLVDTQVTDCTISEFAFLQTSLDDLECHFCTFPLIRFHETTGTGVIIFESALDSLTISNCTDLHSFRASATKAGDVRLARNQNFREFSVFDSELSRLHATGCDFSEAFFDSTKCTIFLCEDCRITGLSFLDTAIDSVDLFRCSFYGNLVVQKAAFGTLTKHQTHFASDLDLLHEDTTYSSGPHRWDFLNEA